MNADHGLMIDPDININKRICVCERKRVKEQEKKTKRDRESWPLSKSEAALFSIGSSGKFGSINLLTA